MVTCGLIAETFVINDVSAVFFTQVSKFITAHFDRRKKTIEIEDINE